jgi:hypothetical protein
MSTDPRIKVTEPSDGRTIASVPRSDGPPEATYAVPGELGALLTEAGYVAEVVVKRADGGAITVTDREYVDDAMKAAAQHGTHSPHVREQVARGHFARVRKNLADKAAPKRKAG